MSLSEAALSALLRVEMLARPEVSAIDGVPLTKLCDALAAAITGHEDAAATPPVNEYDLLQNVSGAWAVDGALAAPSTGDVWRWDGAKWAPAAPAAGVSISKFPNDLSPFALYNFNGDVLDSSGNGRHLTATTPGFVDIYPGFSGLSPDASGSVPTRTDQAFNIPGDITILAMIQSNSYSEYAVFNFSGVGGAQANNYIYQLSAYATTKRLGYFAESGAGSPIVQLGANKSLPYIHNLVWIGLTRASQKVQFWINGKKSGSLSGTLTTPDGGTTSTLHVASATTDDLTIGAIKFWDRALSDSEMAQQYNVTMGKVFGLV